MGIYWGQARIFHCKGTCILLVRGRISQYVQHVAYHRGSEKQVDWHLTSVHARTSLRVKQTSLVTCSAQRICFMPYIISYTTFGKWRFSGVLALLVKVALVLRFIGGKELERVMQFIRMQLNVTQRLRNYMQLDTRSQKMYKM